MPLPFQGPNLHKSNTAEAIKAPRPAPIAGYGLELAVPGEQLADPQLVHSIALAKRFGRKTAHDFNNIMAVIHGFAGILQNRLQQDEVNRGIAQQIEASAQEALKLTNWLSAFANNRSREMVLLDFNKVAEECLSGAWEQKPPQIELEMEFAPEPLLMLGDEVQLEAMCRELWLNAVEAMPGGGQARWQTSLEKVREKVRAATRPGPSSGAGSEGPVDFLRLRVQDNGVGMDRETQNSMFEPFFSTKTGKIRGLGLTTVYDIVHAHRGFIQVSSQPGAGTCVDVYFPAQSASPAPDADTRRRVRKLLVVDDEEMILNMVGHMLRSQDCDVVVAGNGQAALDIYRQSPGEISAVILDMTMPGLSGLETFQKLKALDQRVTVILSTGDPHQQAVRDAMSLGAFGVLSKPFLPQHLADVVNQALA